MSRRVLVEKVKKYGVKEFRGRTKDDQAKVEYWLKNSQLVFDEMACSSYDYLRRTVSLLKDKAYSWWSMLTVRHKPVAEYEREFVHFSKYAHEIVPNEEEICICFEDGLNDKIKMMIGGTEI
ncbi:Hexaprenyldihydroxybenzoate methyltransferase, mitochondrial-like protein [Gossypium australe]|uniref:Hexaprenyldihydroxybenzoate methyltransferase, mitochondrial-like protein n=1 Tax=Gossypium australe TaxID=47621 RepID=A0A5B6VW15_9ROSI|nr:Hexaprenyldihydroxybenzoate methyltransferase, mitochondrial-like protein [Gossypium australe]